MGAPIRDHSLVDVVVTGGARYAARVKEVGHGHAVVRLFEEGSGFPIEAEAAIESVSPDGVVRLEGSAKLGSDGRTIHFEAAPTDQAGLHRRRFPRVPVDRECVLSRRNGSSCAGRIADVSTGGMLVYSADLFELEQVVRFALPWEGDEALITGNARCIRESVGGAYAFEFAAMTDIAQRKLRELIASAQMMGYSADAA